MIRLGRYVSSLIQIQYLQIESIEQATHTNEKIKLKMFYLEALVKCSKHI